MFSLNNFLHFFLVPGREIILLLLSSFPPFVTILIYDIVCLLTGMRLPHTGEWSVFKQIGHSTQFIAEAYPLQRVSKL